MYLKRTFDLIFVSFSLLLLALPLMLLIWWVWRNVGSPVFFTQMRPGLHGVPFKMIKLRTMTSECGSDGALLADAQRLTPFGRFLRASSLDELPELWNVLRGDMSLVGPRPLLMKYLPLYTVEQARRHEVRPGITGWAQVNGRNAISWEEKFQYDCWYVDNHSILLDLKIIFRTLAVIVQKKDIDASPGETMPEFKGQIH